MFGSSRIMAILALALVLIPLAGCGTESPAVSPVATPVPPPMPSPTLEPAAPSAVPSTGDETPQPSSVQTLHDIASNPDSLVGQQVAVEGVLEAEGQMPRLHFFLREGEDHLEVSAWAPLETIQPPEGGAKVKIMAYYVGRRLRLTGTLEQSPAPTGGEGIGGLLLRVTAAEEMQ